jgi:hypothetical protein
VDRDFVDLWASNDVSTFDGGDLDRDLAGVHEGQPRLVHDGQHPRWATFPRPGNY